ncbi:hypothetical protein NPIL_496741 [Nephila pilipes]|uniref:Uncharacterized protein n=1 Tax=Nephila pilipes TaxID=299642 RepID=A0A8X6U952_NEPPI|nr:hypothetical protein NPIL_496741 [Nephila pilipes]
MDLIYQCFSTKLPVIPSESSDSDYPHGQDFDIEYKPFRADFPQIFSQVELNNLTRDLGPSKEATQFLSSRIKEKKAYWPKEAYWLILLVQESRKRFY